MTPRFALQLGYEAFDVALGYRRRLVEVQAHMGFIAGLMVGAMADLHRHVQQGTLLDRKSVV